MCNYFDYISQCKTEKFECKISCFTNGNGNKSQVFWTSKQFDRIWFILQQLNERHCQTLNFQKAMALLRVCVSDDNIENEACYKIP